MKKIKKFTAIVLTMLMITAFIPSQSYAETILAQVEIQDLNYCIFETDCPDFDISIPPDPGYRLATQDDLKALGLEGYEYNYNGVWWRDSTHEKFMSRTDTFSANDDQIYGFTVILLPEPGYSFGFNVGALINGSFNGDIRVKNHFSYLEVCSPTLIADKYKSVIDTVEISDFEIPECGDLPDYNLTIPENCDYHFATADELKTMEKSMEGIKNSVWWEDDEKDRRMNPSEEYLPGHKRYKASIAIVADEGCKLDGNLDVTINGETRGYRGRRTIGNNQMIIRTINFTVGKGTITDFELDSGFTKTDENTYKTTATGEPVIPEPLVKAKSGRLLRQGEGYTVACSPENITLPGKYSVTVEGVNSYTGTATKDLIVTPEPVTGLKVRPTTAKTGYDDAFITWDKSAGATGYQVYARRPSKTEKWTFLGRTEDDDFLKKDLYDGYKYEFKVVPYITVDDIRYRTTEDYPVTSMTTMKKVFRPYAQKAGSTRVKLTWKDISGESGYQLMASRTGKTSYFTTSRIEMSLKVAKGQEYSYKVRAYKNVKKGSKTVRVYGPWSNVRTYTLK